MAEATTGRLVPDWSRVSQAITQHLPASNPFTVGTYQKLLSELVNPNSQDQTYFWRVGLQYKLAGPDGVQPVEWTDLQSFSVRGADKDIPAAYLASASHANKINWAYEVTYLDEGKTNQSISYLDGLGKPRQHQVLLNTQAQVMATETAYSEEGGGPVQTLVAPTNSSQFNYAHRFFDVSEGGQWSDFTTAHFDREIQGTSAIMSPSAVDNTLAGSVGYYYSNNNTQEAYVDAANGFPYAYSVLHKDPLNRLYKTGGVGETFKVTSGKEIETYTTNAQEQELARVYGVDKARTLTNITKTIVRDPNGVESISFTDVEGKVIATALNSCNAPNMNALVEDGMNGFTTRVNVLKNDNFLSDGQVKTSSANFYLSCGNVPVNLRYQIDLGSFTTGPTSCRNCEYTLNIRVVEDATGLDVYSKDLKLPSSATQVSCNTTPTPFVYDESVTLGRAGTYTVYRVLKPYQETLTGRSVVEEAVYTYTQNLYSSLETKRNEFRQELYGRDEWYLMRRLKPESNSNGWAKRIGGTGSDEGHGIRVDGSGNSYVTGFFQGSANFDNITLNSSGATDIFIAKYKPAGNVVWAKKAGGTASDVGHDVEIDGSGNSYIIGAFQGVANFDNITLIASGATDMFIA